MINELHELVSIIVPIYNSEFVLKRCVDSILQQTFKQIQLILVDDGSSDNSLLMCKHFAEIDSRVVVLNQENDGPASARNTGMDAANGKYVMFVDSDDCIHPCCVELMYKAIQQFDVSVVMCEYGEDKCKESIYSKIQVDILNTSTVLRSGLNEKERTLYCWGKLWPAEAVRNHRFKSYSFCEDNLFVVEFFLKYQKSIAYIKGFPLYQYLRHSNSISLNLSDRCFLDSLEIAETILRETDSCTYDIRESAVNYAVNTAFFAYLQTGNEKSSNLVRRSALKIIKRFRKNVLFSKDSLLKAKVACLISFFSMRALKVIYRLIMG